LFFFAFYDAVNKISTTQNTAHETALFKAPYLRCNRLYDATGCTIPVVQPVYQSVASCTPMQIFSS